MSERKRRWLHAMGNRGCTRIKHKPFFFYNFNHTILKQRLKRSTLFRDHKLLLTRRKLKTGKCYFHATKKGVEENTQQFYALRTYFLLIYVLYTYFVLRTWSISKHKTPREKKMPLEKTRVDTYCYSSKRASSPDEEGGGGRRQVQFVQQLFYSLPSYLLNSGLRTPYI